MRLTAFALYNSAVLHLQHNITHIWWSRSRWSATLPTPLSSPAAWGKYWIFIRPTREVSLYLSSSVELDGRGGDRQRRREREMEEARRRAWERRSSITVGIKDPPLSLIDSTFSHSLSVSLIRPFSFGSINVTKSARLCLESKKLGKWQAYESIQLAL